jgi:hypothetical protein
MVSPAARAEDDVAVRIVSPDDGAVVALGEPVAIEIAVGRVLEGCPFSLRVDGKSVWIEQQSYRKSFDTAEWGAGEHWLQAAVFKGDDEVKSPVVWITVEAPEPEPAPQPEELPQESPEAVFGLLPTPKTTSPAQGFQLPFSDGFEDEDLDSRHWFRYISHPNFEIVEFDDELRVSGRTTSREPAVATIQIKAYLNDPVDCSVWFRVQELGCA